MSYLDPIDALDGTPVKPQSWSSVVERYAGTPAAAPLVRLAKAIALSPYSDRLFPVTSMFDIRVYAEAAPLWNRECLLIQFDFDRSTFHFEFYEHSFVEPRWNKKAPPEEAFSAFIHFLALKRWFPAVEIPRGCWICDVTEPA